MTSFLRRFAPQISSSCVVVVAQLLGFAAVGQPLPDSVVTIYSRIGTNGSGQGTGFVVGTDGRVATAYHVIQNATALEVFDKDRRRLTDVVVVWIDPSRDLAILRVLGAESLPALRLEESAPKPQEEIRIAGSPRGLPEQVLFGKSTSSGFVSSTAISSASGRKVFARSIDVLPLDVTIYSGMSGSPVVSQTGRVLGVLSGSYDEGRGIAWAIPGKYLQALAATPPLNRRVDQMLSWPDLTLMDKGWVSLKRSYSRPFTSEHIAQLEVLETAFQTLKGNWKNSDTRKVDLIYDESSLGRCERVVDRTIKVNFEQVATEAPSITGTQRTRLSIAANFSHPRNLNFDSPQLREQREGFCSERIFEDKTVTAREVDLKGDVSVSTKSTDSASRRPGLQSKINVTDCSGSGCNARMYGEFKASPVEIISRERIRWEGAILGR
jgi:hypothetical protein